MSAVLSLVCSLPPGWDPVDVKDVRFCSLKFPFLVYSPHVCSLDQAELLLQCYLVQFGPLPLQRPSWEFGEIYLTEEGGQGSMWRL